MELYKAYSIEYRKGIVKNIPMQKAIKPVNEAIKETIINPKITNGCFKMMATLDLMASIAVRFPKTINGMVINVKKEIVNEVIIPSDFIPA